jgi:lysophospholipid acyltransferase (LPLAT)-like uncharacterized protein
MKLRHPWLLRLFGLVGATVIRAWMNTVRYRAHVLDGTIHPADPRGQRFIYAFWHESVLIPTVFKTRVRVLISQHADGELIAQVCRHLRLGTVRGSTTRGAVPALMAMKRASRDSHLAVTPDGPKGPRRRVQMGLIFLASMTGLPVVPVGVGFGRAWRARSWDRFAVPWPWSTVYGVAPAPIVVPPKLDRAGLEHHRRLVEDRFLAVTAAAERWANAGTRRPPLDVLEEPAVRAG